MMSLYTATITLILVMDPLGNIPIFLSVLNHAAPERRKLIIVRETIIAFLILAAFLFFGKSLLEGMNISTAALEISGGIILFLIALRMIFPADNDHHDSKIIEEPFIVPLAIPLIAGPSAMAVVMLFASQAPEHLSRWMLALFIASLFCTVTLVFADFLRKILGDRGLVALERLMGMILTTMAVQMFLTGVSAFFKI